MIQEEIQRRAKRDDAFFEISAKQLKEFLRIEMDDDEDLEIRFMDYFGKDDDVSLRDYKSEINLLYKMAAGTYGMVEYGYEISFDKFIKSAKTKEAKGNYFEAARIHQELSEVISDNMEMVDDSDGYYGDCFSDAINDMVSCINLQVLTHAEKQLHISYMFEKYIKNDPDYFEEYYCSALEQICKNKHDYNYWMSLLKPYLPEKIPDKSRWSTHYTAKEKVMMHIYILGKLHDPSINDYYTIHYRSDHTICIQYIKYLQKTDSDKALHILEEGLQLYPKINEIKEIACNMYQKTDKKYSDTLMELFFDTHDTKYYVLLKKISKQWSNTVSVIIKHLVYEKSHYALVDVYLSESMYLNAVNHVVSCNDLSMLVDYHKKLAIKYPKQYHTAYKNILPQFAKSKTNRSHYKDVKSYLKKMKTIPRYKNEFIDFVKLIKSQNSTKPAFLDEIKNI